MSYGTAPYDLPDGDGIITQEEADTFEAVIEEWKPTLQDLIDIADKIDDRNQFIRLRELRDHIVKVLKEVGEEVSHAVFDPHALPEDYQ